MGRKDETTDRATEQRTPPAVIAKWVALGAVLAYLVTFVVSNREQVDVTFLFFEARTPLVVALVVTGLLGVVLGWLAAKLRARRSDR